MTEKELESLGFYQDGSFIKQLHISYGTQMDLGWFGIKGNYKELTPAKLIEKIYEIGKGVGYKEGANSIRHSINDILRIEE